MKKSRTFEITIDDVFDQNLEDLKKYYQKSSKAEIFKMAVAALKYLKEAEEKNLTAVFLNSDGTVNKELVVIDRSKDKKETESIRTFTITTDEELDTLISECMQVFNKSTKADVWRLALALLKV